MTAGRARRPFWAARATRFAGLDRRRAKIALAVAALLVLACFFALGTPADTDPIGAAAAAAGQAIVEGLRHGGRFYAVAQATLRDQQAPAMPMPILFEGEALLPGWFDLLLFGVLAAVTVAAWFVRLRPTLQRGATLVPPVLVALGMTVALRAGLVALPAAWAGALIALSLAAHRPARWVEAAALATIAMLIEPAAALYATVMLLFALAESRGGEAFGWAAALAAFVLAFALHLGAIESGTTATAGLVGLAAVIRAAVEATALAALPMVVAAPLAGLALIGWAGCPDPAAPRITVLLAAYAVFLAVVATGEGLALVMLVTPILFVGLAFAPDAIGDLAHRALDRRRITVTKAVR